MRRLITVGVVVLVMSTPVMAAITQVYMLTNFGVDANYASATGNLDWSGGNKCFVLLDDNPFYVVLDGTVAPGSGMTGPVDSSSGGTARADFASGGISINLSYEGVPVGSISAQMVPSWTYFEEEVGENSLEGSTLVRITSFSLTMDATTYGWEGGINDIGGLEVSTTLPQDAVFDDYDLDDYSSENASR